MLGHVHGVGLVGLESQLEERDVHQELRRKIRRRHALDHQQIRSASAKNATLIFSVAAFSFRVHYREIETKMFVVMKCFDLSQVAFDRKKRKTFSKKCQKQFSFRLDSTDTAVTE